MGRWFWSISLVNVANQSHSAGGFYAPSATVPFCQRQSRNVKAQVLNRFNTAPLLLYPLWGIRAAAFDITINVRFGPRLCENSDLATFEKTLSV